MAPSFEILAHEDTPLGVLCLRRRELLSDPGVVVTEITLEHELLMSSHLTASERALSRLGLEMHSGDNLKVLIGGLGLGYTAAEALASDRVARVQVIEFLPPVLRWMRDGMLPLSDTLVHDTRFVPQQGDVYAQLAAPPDAALDVILIDVDHSPDENLGGDNAKFYTRDGLGQARRHLAPDGVLGVWSYAESSPFSEALHEVFSEVRVVPVSVHNPLVDVEQTDWLFFAR